LNDILKEKWFFSSKDDFEKIYMNQMDNGFSTNSRKNELNLYGEYDDSLLIAEEIDEETDKLNFSIQK